MLLDSCSTPEEVADMAAYLADPDREERERNARHRAILNRVADIG